MSGGIYSNVQPSMLGLEMSLHHSLPPQNPQNPHHLSQQHHPTAAFATHDGDYHPQQPAKQAYPKSKNQSLTLSDDEEPGFTAENSADDGKRKVSPWQRMKWTDNMVRLLIMVVFYIGDEVGSEANDPASKKKGGGVLQKKGKWKSVSRAMMERGFYVSPQQCEDKFNDLNKRYKRVNDILGKGTSCRVVENQALLDSMDLSPKMKEEVKKLLNSKHLFFREMCAYHNSCGHGNGGGGPSSAEAASQPQQQRCLHSAEKASIMPNLNRGKGASVDDDDDEDEEEEEDAVEEEEEEEEDEDENEMEERITMKKRARKGAMHHSSLIQQLDGEITNVFRDGSKSSMEKRQWLKTKMMALEEQRVEMQTQSLELEKQRLKWLKFSSKKEREMEREKLVNERVKLENERMVLLIRHKELDLMDHHHHQQQHSSNKKNDPSSITG